MSIDSLSKIFPNLANHLFEITSPKTTEYNCIAWAANDNSSWWWPDQNNIYFWPETVDRKATIDAFVNAYKTIGYEICENGYFEQDFEKIAIYIGKSGMPTHAAKQINETQWTSKLGQSFDVSHSIDGVSGEEYGEIGVFMKRPKS